MRYMVSVMLVATFFSGGAAAQQLEPVGQEKGPAQTESRAAESPVSPEEIMRSFRTIQVQTGTWLAKPEMCEGALQKRKEFDQWGLFLLRSAGADVLLKIDHQPGWFYYQYSMVHRASGLVLAAGNVSAWDGPAACGKVAEKIVERVKQVRVTPQSEDQQKKRQEKEKEKDKKKESDKEKSKDKENQSS